MSAEVSYVSPGDGTNRRRGDDIKSNLHGFEMVVCSVVHRR